MASRVLEFSQLIKINSRALSKVSVIITPKTLCDTSHVGPDHNSQREFHSESQISDAATNSIHSEVRSQQ